jgi:rubrerythrin
MKKTASRRSATALEPARAEFLYQVLETELGGVDVYRAALQSVDNAALRDEWEKYLEHTEIHVRVARKLLESAGLDPDVDTPGRQVLRTIAKSLVQAIELARGNDDPRSAEIVAAECVLLAETKDHANWGMVECLAEAVEGELGEALTAALDAVAADEQEHLRHNQGWARELLAASLGLDAELPPPEENGANSASSAD